MKKSSQRYQRRLLTLRNRLEPHEEAVGIRCTEETLNSYWGVECVYKVNPSTQRFPKDTWEVALEQFR